MVSLGMQNLRTKFHIHLLGDHAIVFKINTGLQEGIDHDLLALSKFIATQEIVGLKDLIPAYETLTLIYDIVSFDSNPYLFAHNLLEAFIESTSIQSTPSSPSKLIEVPVCYDPLFGIDLQTALESSNCNLETLIQLHSEKIYTVYCLGFMPGFAYMGDVHKAIQLPRHAAPRNKVQAGSVGIAGKQTGIYPMNAPGGWQLIGRTPYKIFDANSATLTLFKTGDQVKFVPISIEKFHQLNAYNDVH